MADQKTTTNFTVCSVKGKAFLSNGQPAVGCTIEAIDKDLSLEKTLGICIADAQGFYEITYEPTQLSNAVKLSADLIVKLIDQQGLVLATSPLLSSAPTHAIVDLRSLLAIAEPSEYERLLAAITPRLQGLDIVDLTPEQIAYLSQVTGWETHKIELLIKSAQLAVSLANCSAGKLPVETYYAWLQQGLPAEPKALLRQTRDRLSTALAKAHTENIVNVPLADALEPAIVARKTAVDAITSPLHIASAETPAWSALAAELILLSRIERELVPASDPGELTVHDLFSAFTAPGFTADTQPVLTTEKLRVLAELVLRDGPQPRPSAEELDANGFLPEERNLALRTYALADLTQSHLPLIRDLNAMALPSPDAIGSGFAYLAPLTLEDWRAKLDSTGGPPGITGETEQDRLNNYAEMLEQRVESAHRTAVLAARIGQDRVAVPHTAKPDLDTFFANNPGFSFKSHYVQSFLDTQGSALLEGIQDPSALKRNLLTLERTIKLTDNHRQHSVLLANQFDSAQKISRYGERDFVSQVGNHPDVGSEAAAKIFGRAQHTAAIALNLAMRYRNDGFNLPVLASASSASPTTLASGALAGSKAIPDLSTLFGTLDGSACDPNLSVLSPGAYFVDIMKYLDDRRSLMTVDHPSGVGISTYVMAEGSNMPIQVDGTCMMRNPTLHDVVALVNNVPMNSMAVSANGKFSLLVSLAPGTYALTVQLRPHGGGPETAMMAVERSVTVLQVSGSVKLEVPTIEQVFWLAPGDSYCPVQVEGSITVSPDIQTEVFVTAYDRGFEVAASYIGPNRFAAVINVGSGTLEVEMLLRTLPTQGGILLASAKGIVRVLAGRYTLTMDRPWNNLEALLAPGQSITQVSVDGVYSVEESGGQLSAIEVVVQDAMTGSVTDGNAFEGVYSAMVPMGIGDHPITSVLRGNYAGKPVILGSVSRELSVTDADADLDITAPSGPVEVDATASTFNLQVDGHFATTSVNFEIILLVDGSLVSVCALMGSDGYSGMVTVARGNHDIKVQLRSPPGSAGMVLASTQAQVIVTEPMAVLPQPLATQTRADESINLITTAHLEANMRSSGLPSRIPIAASVTAKAAGIRPDSPLAALLARRPDLAEIELSTANSNILMSYTDLVLEILENAVATSVPQDLGIAAGDVPTVTGLLNVGTVPPALKSRFQSMSAIAWPDDVVERVYPMSDTGWQIAIPGFRIAISSANNTLTLESIFPQTSETVDAIVQQPEHIDPAAYDGFMSLQQAGYPWSLPFDLWIEQGRLYLAHLGVPRDVLMQTFYRDFSYKFPESGPMTTANFMAATERFGLSVADMDIISGRRVGTGPDNDPNSGLWNFWGFNAEGLSPTNSIPDPLDTTKRIDGTTADGSETWIQALVGPTSRVDVVLQQSGLSYNELREVLDMRFVNTTDAGTPVLELKLGVQYLVPDDSSRMILSSDLSLAKLLKAGNNVTDSDVTNVLDRLHRFVRLWRKTGWQMRDLDRAASVAPRLGGTVRVALNEGFIGTIDRWKQLNQLHHHQPESFIGISPATRYRDYSIADEPPVETLYDRLFLNRSITNPLDPAFELNDARTELIIFETNPKVLIKDHLPQVAAACGLSRQEAELLLQWAGPEFRLRLANLSTMYWAALAARNSKVSIKELLDLMQLVVGNGFFSSWANPKNVSQSISQPVELGFKFSSSGPGEINTLRFWKPQKETGVHVGKLWHSNGTLLGTVTFRNETASGWQEQRFITPIPIQGNTVYVVSVNANEYYGMTENGIPAGQVGYLIPVTDGTNGVRGNEGEFPTQSASSPNYFRDVGFRSHVATNSTIVLPETLRAAGFSPAEAIYLLAHKQSSEDAEAEILAVAANLEVIRKELTAIALAEVPLASDGDPQGASVTRELVALDWNPQVIEEVLSICEASFSVPLKNLPIGVTLPAANNPGGCVTFVGGRLVTSKLLDTADLNALKALSSDVAYIDAVQSLFDLPKQRIDRNLSTFEPRDTSVALAEWPSALTLPADYSSRIYFDAIAKQLHVVGVLDDASFVSLQGLNGYVLGSPFDLALKSLRVAYETLPPGALPMLSNTDRSRLLNPLSKPADRYAVLLDKLIPHRREVQSVKAIQDRLATSLGLASATVGKLLTAWVWASAGPAHGFAVSDFLQPNFAQGELSLSVNPARFPDQFKTYLRLKKVAILVAKFRLSDRALGWLFNQVPDQYGLIGWVDPNRLPASSDESPISIRTLLRTANLYGLRDAFSGGDEVLGRVFAAAAADASTDRSTFLAAVATATGWALDELTTLVGPDGFNLGGIPLTDAALKTAFQDEWLMLRLVSAFAVMRRLGAKAAQCLEWSKPAITREAAADIKQLARAHYTEQTWSDVAKPLQDTMRERQRAALVVYLIGKHQLRDSTDLYNRYLIDVEMQPAALTSRIKQACASVQLFVQRCLLNLEPDVSPETIDTDLWAWMKNYRIWEANRKVFLFPENWIEPELRDDKSEFFRQLESDLLQSNVTHEAGMTAFANYVNKLAEVARLNVVNMFDELAVGGKRIVHVLARNGSTPHRYFYRQWVIPASADAGYWTTWEEVTAGIDGEHILLFALDGMTCIAWPTIKQGKAAGLVNITMNLTSRQHNRWSSRRSASGSLSTFAAPNLDDSGGFVFRTANASLNAASMCTRIDCYHAVFPVPLITSPRDFKFTVVTTQGNSAAAQIMGADLRILIRFSDDSNRTYYWTPLPAQECKIFVTGWVLMGGTGITIPHLKQEYDFFTTPNINLVDYFGQNGICTKLNLGVEGPKSRYKIISAPIEFDISNAATFTLAGDFVLELIDPSLPLIDPERTPLLNQFGAFYLTDFGRFAVSDSAVTNSSLPPADISDTQNYCSYYRELRNRGGQDELKIGSKEILTATPGRFLICPCVSSRPAWGYSDNDVDLAIWQAPNHQSFRMVPLSFYWAGQLAQFLSHGDLRSVIDLQQTPASMSLPLNPTNIDKTGSVITVDIGFDPMLPWATYNWELFFHIPVIVATQLAQNQRFEEALRWLHITFDPTFGNGGTDGRQYWRFKPFAADTTGFATISIEQELLALATGVGVLPEKIAAQISQWKEHPFQPHLIARSRPRAYQLFVVRKYIDTLISWGDQLFQRDTIESINEATQLYILASEILGRRPLQISTHQPADVKTYSQLQTLDDFSNALVQVESLIPAVVGNNGTGNAAGAPHIYSLYFGIPANQELASYWDTVEDRLFKIRHSLNIRGVARQLPLYEPPIDPAILVRAVAAGVDIASALADLQSPLPHYRFNMMTQKALELVNDVKGFGASLLSALEKRDAEGLAQLRSSHEISLLKMVETVKEKQRDEAQANVDALRKTRELISQRYLQYGRLLGKIGIEAPPEGALANLDNTPSKALASSQTAGGDTGGLALAKSEVDHLGWMNVANNYSIASGSIHTVASILHALPDEISGPIIAQMEIGGSHFGHAADALASLMTTLATNASFQGTSAATIGGHQRRYDDWAFQSNLAAKELEQVDKQIAAAEIRVAIAEQELTIHQKQMDNAQEVDDFMHGKFTNAQLYRWMSGQAAGMYFRAYQMAFDLAKRAEKSFRFELGLEDKDSNFIQFGYWDSLKKGLLAGENLGLDIKRMEVSYLDKNKRELEITRHISLRQLDAAALMNLRGSDGACEFDIPELLFDLDFPGHYFRRIKSVSISIPCVAGPYTSVSGTLTLLSNKLRNKPLTNDYKADSNYRSTYLPVQSIATSSGQNDSGLFELNFRDERYLPFEGAGVISRWRFALPKQHKAFDYSTISDLIIHLHYTARDGGETLAVPARDNVEALLSSAGKLHLLLSIRQDFPDEWPKFKQGNTTASVTIDFTDNHLFPYFARGNRNYADPIAVFKVNTDKILGNTIVPVNVKIPAATPIKITLNDLGDVSNLADLLLIVPYTLPKQV